MVLHDRVLRARSRARRAAAFYEAGIARVTDTWAGTGESGERFLVADHPYAADLDLFGRGSLFELLTTARIRAGEETLARWLLAPATTSDVRARQEAVRELQPLRRSPGRPGAARRRARCRRPARSADALGRGAAADERTLAADRRRDPRRARGRDVGCLGAGRRGTVALRAGCGRRGSVLAGRAPARSRDSGGRRSAGPGSRAARRRLRAGSSAKRSAHRGSGRSSRASGRRVCLRPAGSCSCGA